MRKGIQKFFQKILGIQPPEPKAIDLQIHVSVEQGKILLKFNKTTDHVWMDRNQCLGMIKALSNFVAQAKP